jgi:hypothetical protein
VVRVIVERLDPILQVPDFLAKYDRVIQADQSALRLSRKSLRQSSLGCRGAVADWVAKVCVASFQVLIVYGSLRGSSSMPVMQPRHRGLTKQLPLQESKSLRIPHGLEAFEAEREGDREVVIPRGRTRVALTFQPPVLLPQPHRQL